MPFTRDPLSEAYDGPARRVVRSAMAAPGRWVNVTVTRPAGGSRALRVVRARGLRFLGEDAGGLAEWERAWQRAAYYYFDHTARGAPDSDLSLQRVWGMPGPRGRRLSLRVSSRPAARRAAGRMPESQRWRDNPALRSGGQGSPHQRF